MVVTTNGIHPYGMKFGTEYEFFDETKDLSLATRVYVKKLAAVVIGRITQIIDKETCRVDGSLTFISDIQYKITKIPSL